MIEMLLGALLIMCMRITDVTIGTFRTLMVVQARRYHAAVLGFFEVLIWIFAMKYIVQHMDNYFNLVFYALGFALGNILGITIEQHFAIGHVQLIIISKDHIHEIAAELRSSHFAATLIPGEGNDGSSTILFSVVRRKDQKNIIKLIESVDPNAFIAAQHSKPYRGYIHGARK